MELRGSTHFHFIQAVKGGSVTKSMNVGSRGRPALKFKEIKDVYNLGDTVYHNQVPTIYLRDDLDSLPTECPVVGVESTDSSFMRGIKIKSEPEASDFNCYTDGSERNNDLDDFSFGNMTLKQFKKRCKTKKRKHFDSVGSNKDNVETCSSVSHEFPNFQQKDDEYDLEEPLISLKSKLSKNMKSKSKSSRKSVSISSPKFKSIIKSEQFKSDEDFLQPNRDWPAPLDVKVEVPEPCYSECQTIFPVCIDVPETTNVHILKTEAPCPTEEPQYCSLNEVSYEYMRNFEPKFDVGVSGWEIVQVDSPEIVSYNYSDLSGFGKEDYIIHPRSYDVSSDLMSPTKDYSCDIHDRCQSNSLIQAHETTIDCGLETQISLYPIECCVSNGVSYESTEDVNPKFGARFSGWEIVKVDSPEIISDKCSNFQEVEKESYATHPLAYDVSSQSISPTMDHCTDLHDSFKGNSSQHKKTRNYGQIEVPEININNSLQCLEDINEGSACFSESRSTHDWPSNIRNITINPSSDNGLHCSSSCLNPEGHSDLVSGDSPSGKQSLSPASISTNGFDASAKPMASSGPPDYHQMKHRHCPERILSNRKAISPTSQERLCRAMDLAVDENERHQCRGKLYFGKPTNHRILRAQGLDQFWRDGVTLKPKSVQTKAKQDKKESPPKGILKVRRVSGTCTTVQQSAIAFTQQQMRDIESLATKLTAELKSMKDIVKRKLQLESEASVATSVKENADEVRIAIENATTAEETARKFLSMMARDCNRFRKIMSQRMTEDNTVAAERVIHKERKITFADEAGGKLCHVKVFKDDMGTASLLECSSEKQRLQVE